MIDLTGPNLTFSFPEVHEDARFSLGFQRTLRIPDDDSTYPLPPGLGPFPVSHVDDFPDGVPASWLRHGGVMVPMYQSEALWLMFNGNYPMAIKVATGKINAVTGAEWSDGLHSDPQDYLVTPTQPWLDGYCVEKGYVRQFVAMPLGAGYTAEEQITGEAEFGGIQVIAYPMKAEVWERYRVSVRMSQCETAAMFSPPSPDEASTFEMGLAPGGRMKQEIYDDQYGIDVWDLDHSSRCFVHIANSLAWRAITGEDPPSTPATASEYSKAGLPWFEYYDDGATALDGSAPLADLKTVTQVGAEKGDVPLPENESVTPENIVHMRAGLREGQVREGVF